jgi:NitT/TauT family transport system substrate-binding protein
MKRPTTLAFALFCAVVAAACGPASGPAGTDPETGAQVVRLGHFPNVTHAHGLVAHAMTREGKGWFEERLGPGTKVEWYTYNAGPSAMEALLVGSIDATYVGPNPVINAHIKAKGADVRVLSGATRGGAALVVQGDGKVNGAADLKGKTLATPQLGNTQDVAARAWLAEHGLEVTLTGGDVKVLPTANPGQLALFTQGDLAAVWTVEPWVSRLEREAKGKILVEEKDAVTTVLAASVKFSKGRRELAERLLRAHEELTAWIAAHPDEAKRLVRSELKEETRAEMPAELLDHCWPRLRFSPKISVEDFVASLRGAQAAGFLKEAGDPATALSRLVEGGE